MAYLYAKLGRRQDALKLVRELTRLSERQYVDPFDLVVSYAALDNNQAFERLERAYEDVRPGWLSLKVNPFLEPLRSDRRFQDLLRQMNFPS